MQFVIPQHSILLPFLFLIEIITVVLVTQGCTDKRSVLKKKHEFSHQVIYEIRPGSDKVLHYQVLSKAQNIDNMNIWG